MDTFRSGDAQISYDTVGSGPSVILLHPFPLNREFWKPVVGMLSSRYQLVLPDLRGHGDSDLGEGPATMEKHAEDLRRLCRNLGIGKAHFVGVSIGGYILFEFWRRYREQVSAVVLANTRAEGETPEGKAGRYAAAERVLKEGTAEFIEEMLGKMVSPVTRGNRPDLVEQLRVMMKKMSADDVAGVQRGMAERLDSIPTLPTIDVPVRIIAGEEDSVPHIAFETMQQRIPGSRLYTVARAGHYAAFEQPEEFGRLLRTFFDELPRQE